MRLLKRWIRHVFILVLRCWSQANIYRNESNLLDLYVILLRYSRWAGHSVTFILAVGYVYWCYSWHLTGCSLLCETIPKHRDYHAFKLREKAFFDVISLSSTLEIIFIVQSWWSIQFCMIEYHTSLAVYLYSIKHHFPPSSWITTSSPLLFHSPLPARCSPTFGKKTKIVHKWGFKL
jgi:hypothetical protein